MQEIKYVIAVLTDSFGRFCLCSEDKQKVLNSLTVEEYLNPDEGAYDAVVKEITTRFQIPQKVFYKNTKFRSFKNDIVVTNGIRRIVSMYVCQIDGQITLRHKIKDVSIKFLELKDIVQALNNKTLTLSYCGRRMFTYLLTHGITG